ncbi:MAG: SHOCT domain-containing protein [Candidatus Roizmanbacteria bacterium]|nr:SHOCT domain-containing protein [Candidatus Roizmanbacteria bacterium]
MNKGGENYMMGYYGNWDNWNNMMGWGGFGMGWIFMLIFWGVVIWIVISLIKGSHGRGHMCGHDHEYDEHEKENSPLEILKERYAKGEIDKKQFEEIKKDLK